jgi:hypothetical protein
MRGNGQKINHERLGERQHSYPVPLPVSGWEGAAETLAGIVRNCFPVVNLEEW